LELAEKGDHKNIDMLVKDIYGGGYDALGLDNDLIASSLGKTTRSRLDNNCTREEHLKKFKQEDLVKSILIAICYDLSQLASLHAKINNVKKVIFGGYFISKNLLTMRFLKHGISYWSQVNINFYL
jgi:pantothenate kinase